jgi:serine/threonine protein phosphatase PrpC
MAQPDERPTETDLPALTPTEAASTRRHGPQPAVVDVAAASHCGHVRANNEDHFVVARLARSLEMIATNLPPGRVPQKHELASYALAVADGMGGAEAGEVASELALSLGTDLALGESSWHLRPGEDEARHLVDRVQAYFAEIHRTVAERARTSPALAGMGTTLTVVYCAGQDVFVFHVGDSRAYLLRGDDFRQLTRDQTLVQALADAGQIAPDAVQTHRLRHVLTHAIGASTIEVEASSHRFHAQDGDRLLLCTDGLTDMASDTVVASALATAPTADTACQRLIDLALAGGGRDNVTVVVAFFATHAVA